LFWKHSTHARDHQAGITAPSNITDHMAPNLTISPPVSLKIQTLNSQQLEANKITTERPDPLYRPGDIIPAVIEVHKYKQFEAVSLHSSLIGPQSLHSDNRPQSVAFALS
jgi:hypothetical protein